MNNPQLQSFARQTLIEGLNQLPAGHQEVFKLMYGRADGNRSVEDAKALTIEEVVANVPSNKLDWAMTQVQNSLKKLSLSTTQTSET